MQNKNARAHSRRKIFCEKALQRRKNGKHIQALKQNIAKAEKNGESQEKTQTQDEQA
ncbi:MAG: hypothetical protein IJI37_00150 [Opitutales bacterium]|nr:hypothetical protein [Opitutales bacterium]